MQSPPNLKTLSSDDKDSLILLLWNQNQQLMKQIARFEEEINALKSQLSQNSRNSSKPPSSDGYGKPKPKSQRKKSTRSSGGQPGHKGHTLKQVEHPDQTEHHEVSHCSQCGEDLSTHSASEHEARQVFDLPEIKIQVTEHRAEIKVCPHCEGRTKGTFPNGVTQAVQYGEGVQAMATYLSHYQLLPYQRLQELFQDLFNVSLSQGTLNRLLTRGYQHLEEFEQGVKTRLKTSTVVHFDESGLRVKARLHWLHVASTPQLTYYHIDPKRGHTAMQTMGILPEYRGHAVHDHWKSYYRYDCSHVLCNSHHLRELTFAKEQHQQSWAKKVSDCLIEANKEVEQAKEKGHTSLQKKRVLYFDRRYSRLLRDGRDELPMLPTAPTNKRGRTKQHKVKNLHDRLRNHKKEVLAFLYNFALPFGNNLAERDVRMIKVKQKVSGCFRSDQGAVVFCRIRGYISTVKKQQVNVFSALSDLFSGKDLPVSLEN